MNRQFFLLAPLLSVFLGGCAVSDSPQNDPVRGIAASFVAARSFDRARLALQRDDKAAFDAALAAFTRAQSVNQGSLGHWMLSNDLNARGYELAENGKTSADFERAIALTRQALDEADKFIATLSPDDKTLPDALWGRASGPRDSHAWALFKAGRLEAAKAQQELALKELAASKSKQKVTAEIPLHMAEIYRALGEKDKARRQYEAASRLEPDAAIRARIASGLKSLGAN